MNNRPEHEIFDDLRKVCISPGFVHALAFLSVRDTVVRYAEEITPWDMQHMFSKDRLVRTEIATLLGLMVKEEIDLTFPGQAAIECYLNTAESLLQEIHQALFAPLRLDLEKAMAGEPTSIPTIGKAAREPIFYSGESAYMFQYRDLSAQRYDDDCAWLEANRRFTMQAARDVAYAISIVQNQKLTEWLRTLKTLPANEWTVLPALMFTIEEVARVSTIETSVISEVLSVFSLSPTERNNRFVTISDFNCMNATPILRKSVDEFILFQTYSFAEALYESPFYWMIDDPAYRDAASRNRGRFTEAFACKKLQSIFGTDAVHTGVNINRTKQKRVGEIDILVLFGNRAIIVQAKSKQLTIEARKGNDGQLQEDFRQAIQASYDQGNACALSMLDGGNHKFINDQSQHVTIPTDLKAIYILCLVCDHYPALSFQTRQFLKFAEAERVPAPFVMDVFTLDAITEMLESPLHFVSYVDRRTYYSDRIMASHETTILSYHLKNNLWFDDTVDIVMLQDDISTDLDVAMTVRREGLPGKRTPDGILTRLTETPLGRVVKSIEMNAGPEAIDLGLMLLKLSEETVVQIGQRIEEIIEKAHADSKEHTLLATFKEGRTGLVVHCNEKPNYVAMAALERHCRIRKYTEHADSWFGLCIRPEDGSVRFALELDYKWESRVEGGDLPLGIVESTGLSIKVGRNEKCPCGSGKKYKKCHGANG